MTTIRLCVAGGRYYGETMPGKRPEKARRERLRLYDRLDAIAREYTIEVLIHGACIVDGKQSGADYHAECWARQRDIPALAFPVDHALDGEWPSAGPRRSRRMLRDGHATHLLACPGGKGTAACVDAATRCKPLLTMWEIRP